MSRGFNLGLVSVVLFSWGGDMSVCIWSWPVTYTVADMKDIGSWIPKLKHCGLTREM